MPDPARQDETALVHDVDIAKMIANLLADATVTDEDRLRLVFLEKLEDRQSAAPTTPFAVWRRSWSGLASPP